MTSEKQSTSYYVASRASVLARSRMWREFRDKKGVNILSSWIDLVEEDHDCPMSALWGIRIPAEISQCDCLVVYVEPTDLPLKGVFIEAGMALMVNKPVRIVAPDVSRESLGSWVEHPLVTFAPSLDDAFAVCPKPVLRYIR